MKHAIAIMFLTLTSFSMGLAMKQTITNSGFTFSPTSITIKLGDTIIFSLSSIHYPLEVNLATWNANSNTPLEGGFSTPLGGGTVVLTSTGTHYYVCGIHYAMGMKGSITVTSATGVLSGGQEQPLAYGLDQSFPNPFNPSTDINYQIAGLGRVTLRVYNLLGQQIATLVDEAQPPGAYTIRFNGSSLPSGIYFYKLEAGNFTYVRKMVLIK